MNSKGTEFRIGLIGFFVGLLGNILYFDKLYQYLMYKPIESNVLKLGTALGFQNPVTFANLCVFFTTIFLAIFISSIVIGHMESYAVIKKDELDRLLRK